MQARLESILRDIAARYADCLARVDWSDEWLVAADQEGRNKVLSGLWLKCPSLPAGKYARAQWASSTAVVILEGRDKARLVFEHAVPKSTYIQKPCEAEARAGTLTTDTVFDLLKRYWHVVAITTSEDARLTRAGLRNRMPEGWDRVDPFARYAACGIELQPNPRFRILTD